MPRPPKATPSRSTPRPSTRSQQQSPPRAKPSVVLTLKSSRTASSRGETSDNDNDSVCSSSKSSEIPLRGTVAKDKVQNTFNSNRAPWRHPDELDYFRPSDWSEDKIISQLRSMVFSVPPPVLGKQSFIEITLYAGGDFDKPKRVKVPRGYRVPLMFVAKFQWASLKLVLTSGQREKEWSDYKFDILHLSRLCERFFTEAQKACQRGIVEIPPIKSKAAEVQTDPEVMTRRWRCPTFDRALARYNKNWLISREEFLRDFYIEFEDEEYLKDVLKIDWSRWALKGHKGFKLTPDELKIGIDGRMITRGLKKDSNGKWIWIDDYVIKQEEVAAAVLPSEIPLPVAEINSAPHNHDLPSSPVPSMPVRNGHASPFSNDVSVGPISITEKPTMTHAAQSVETAIANSHTAQSGEQFLPELSEHKIIRECEDQQAIQLNSTEKSHSPLTSLPSSATPSIPVPLPPPDIVEPMGDDIEAAKREITQPSSTAPPPDTTSEIINLRPSPLLHPTLESETLSRPTSLQPPSLSPLTIPAIPSHRHSPQSSELFTPSAASVSEATQPPRSHSPPPISSPGTGSKSIDLAAETSPLTPLHPETSFGEHEQDDIFTTPAGVPTTGTENPETDLRLSPTSIDSTPTPSPTIQPLALTKSISTIPSPELDTPTNDPNGATIEVPMPLSAKEPFVDPPCLFPVKPSTMDDLSRESPPLIPRQSSHPSNDIVSTRSPSPAILSPLLPPTTRPRSASLEEIPGLGGLSSRRPYTMPPQFVIPSLTARTVTHGSSWNIPELGEEAKDDSLDDSAQLQYPSFSPDLSENPQAGTTIEAEPHHLTPDGANLALWVPSQVEENLHSDQAVQSDRPTSTATPQVEMTSQGRKVSHVQGSDHDDDSDMDFGTPVTSPVIIVPSPNVASIDMLPPPVSPCPAPLSKCGSPSQVRQNSLKHARPHDVITNTQMFASFQSSQDGTLTSMPTSPYLPEVSQPASDSDAVMMILESVARDHAEKVDKAERVSPLNGFISPSASTNSTSLHSSKSLVPRSSTPLYPHQPVISNISPSVQEENSRPLLPSSPPLASLASALPVSHSMASITTSSPGAPNSRTVEGRAVIGGHAGLGSVTTASQPDIVSAQHVDIDGAAQRPQTEKIGFSSEKTQTNYYVSHRAPPLILSNSSVSSNSEVSGRSLNLNDSSLMAQNRTPSTEYSSLARKRQRDEDGDGWIDEEAAFKIQKTGESLTVREGGLVVRKVVSMVRDTLTGLNDLLEIAAERDLIPSEKARAVSKGKARAMEALSRDGSPISAPSLSSPVARSPFFSYSQVESSEVTRLNEELRMMKAEMAQLKEQKLREPSTEQSYIGAMRTELEALREQLRVLKEEKRVETGASEVQAMHNEIISLKNEMRSLLSPSNRSSGGPTAPSTPNLSFRLNNHPMSQTIHPLAHLLVVEPETVPSTPTTASTVEMSQSQDEGEVTRISQKARVHSVDGSRSNSTHIAPRTPAVFDDIPLPVKSKRKSRIFFSRG